MPELYLSWHRAGRRLLDSLLAWGEICALATRHIACIQNDRRRWGPRSRSPFLVVGRSSRKAAGCGGRADRSPGRHEGREGVYEARMCRTTLWGWQSIKAKKQGPLWKHWWLSLERCFDVLGSAAAESRRCQPGRAEHQRGNTRRAEEVIFITVRNLHRQELLYLLISRLSSPDPLSRSYPLRITHCNCPPREPESATRQANFTSFQGRCQARLQNLEGPSLRISKTKGDLWNCSGHVCNRTAKD